MGIVRGCGSRAAGGVYLMVPTDPNGVPLETFLCDPPVRLPDTLPVSPLGVTLIEQDGITHVVDWVSGSYYPNLANYLEEARRFGVSRRVSKVADFGRLGPGSRLIQVHAKAIVENWAEYPQPPCPKRHVDPKHTNGDRALCAGLWWIDIDGGEPTGQSGPGHLYEVTVKQPSFSYTAYRRPQGVAPDYTAAIFASFPIGGIEVIRDEGGSHHEALEAAQRSHLPVALMDE